MLHACSWNAKKWDDMGFSKPYFLPIALPFAITKLTRNSVRNAYTCRTARCSCNFTYNHFYLLHKYKFFQYIHVY